MSKCFCLFIKFNGYNIYPGSKYGSNISLQGEIGPYLRNITNFNNSSSINYSDNSVIGVQIALNIKYDLSKNLFAIMSLTTNRDLDDIITSSRV